MLLAGIYSLETNYFHTLLHIAQFCCFRPLHFTDPQPFFCIFRTIDSLYIDITVALRREEWRHFRSRCQFQRPPLFQISPLTQLFFTSAIIFAFVIIFMRRHLFVSSKTRVNLFGSTCLRNLLARFEGRSLLKPKSCYCICD